jgi:uroporphyrin-III C-methyltransferase
VFLVGAGPGDPRLLTVRAAELIAHADVILYDRLVGDAIVASFPPEAEAVYVGKHPEGAPWTQDAIVSLMVARAREGRRVLRLKGGDPFVFGRGGEEGQELDRAGVAWEVVPGITSALAAPAAVGIPVTHRDFASEVTIVTGHEGEHKGGAPVDWARLARTPGTLVVLMGVAALAANAERLMEGGMAPDRPAAVVERATLPDQRAVFGTLADIAAKAAAARLRPPAVLVVGEVVRLARREGA